MADIDKDFIVRVSKEFDVVYSFDTAKRLEVYENIFKIYEECGINMYRDVLYERAHVYFLIYVLKNDPEMRTRASDILTKLMSNVDVDRRLLEDLYTTLIMSGDFDFGFAEYATEQPRLVTRVDDNEIELYGDGNAGALQPLINAIVIPLAIAGIDNDDDAENFEEILNFIRNNDPDEQSTPRTIYDDKHNVHAVVREATRVAKKFIDDYAEVLGEEGYRRPFYHKFLLEIEEFDEADTNDQVKLTDLFMTIFNYALRIRCRNDELALHYDDLYKRLVDEMNDSVDTCYAGHLCRLVNVLSGGFFDHEYEMRVDEFDYAKAKYFNALTRLIGESGRDFTSGDDVEDVVAENRYETFGELDDKTLNKILFAYTYDSRWKQDE